MDKENYTNVILEEMREQQRSIIEYVRDVPMIIERLGRVEDKVDFLQSDMVVVKATLRDHSEVLNQHTKVLDRQTETPR